MFTIWQTKKVPHSNCIWLLGCRQILQELKSERFWLSKFETLIMVPKANFKKRLNGKHQIFVIRDPILRILARIHKWKIAHNWVPQKKIFWNFVLENRIRMSKWLKIWVKFRTLTLDLRVQISVLAATKSQIEYTVCRHALWAASQKMLGTSWDIKWRETKAEKILTSVNFKLGRLGYVNKLSKSNINY